MGVWLQVVDSGWSLADGMLDVLLMKENKQNWWKTIMKGDPEINTQKARPPAARRSRQGRQALQLLVSIDASSAPV